MRKCPFSIQVSVDEDGKLNPRVPLFLGFGHEGERHILEAWPKHAEPVGKRKMTLMDVAVEENTGKFIQASPIRTSDLRFQLREFLDSELHKPQPWQELVVIETEWLIRQAGGAARQNWILNTGCVLAADGEKWFSEIRQRLAVLAPSGRLTFRQLVRDCLLTLDSDKKMLRRWLQTEPWTKRGKGGRLCVHVCAAFIWWYVKQRAAAVGLKFCKQGVELTPDGVQVQDGKMIGIEKRALEALENFARLRTQTVGWTLEEIDQDPKKDKIWKLRLSQPLPAWFRNGKNLTTEANALMIANLYEKLRRQSKNGFVAKAAMARALGMSLSTFRRKGYGAVYDALRLHHKVKNEKVDPVSFEQLTQEQAQHTVARLSFGSDHYAIHSDFEDRKATVLTECATCGKTLKNDQPCPKCRVCSKCGRLMKGDRPCSVCSDSVSPKKGNTHGAQTPQ